MYATIRVDRVVFDTHVLIRVIKVSCVVLHVCKFVFFECTCKLVISQMFIQFYKIIRCNIKYVKSKIYLKF